MRIKPYKFHVFVCFSDRCAARGGTAILGEFKRRIKEGAFAKAGGVRVSRTGCLKLCRETDVVGENSPGVIIYPDGVWYACVKVEDVDEIVKSHIEGGAVVERLCYFTMDGS
ncbi:MAG: (2Fe-2S) ferredoxin domain-containing protein [Proteobacteria bacterium]|nr:(2Fe-2S) ferredoxin domain-containing protein [Pseudomonadota bacterium]